MFDASWTVDGAAARAVADRRGVTRPAASSTPTGAWRRRCCAPSRPRRCPARRCSGPMSRGRGSDGRPSSWTWSTAAATASYWPPTPRRSRGWRSPTAFTTTWPTSTCWTGVALGLDRRARRSRGQGRARGARPLGGGAAQRAARSRAGAGVRACLATGPRTGQRGHHPRPRRLQGRQRAARAGPAITQPSRRPRHGGARLGNRASRRPARRPRLGDQPAAGPRASDPRRLGAGGPAPRAGASAPGWRPIRRPCAGGASSPTSKLSVIVLSGVAGIRRGPPRSRPSITRRPSTG